MYNSKLSWVCSLKFSSVNEILLYWRFVMHKCVIVYCYYLGLEKTQISSCQIHAIFNLYMLKI